MIACKPQTGQPGLSLAPHKPPRSLQGRWDPWARVTAHKSCYDTQISAAASQCAAEAGSPPRVPATPPPMPFFPDRRCMEDVQLPPLAVCHHYVNLTNGVEAVPRLQALGLTYRFLRLPSTRCEQQQFEGLINDLDSDLLMRLALGQCCLVYDFGSRNKKRGAPRAVWYGLEFVRYTLRRLWLGECGPAYLRGYSVKKVFEEHVAAFSKSTQKKVRYYAQYIQPGGLPNLHLYGVYAPTKRDGDRAYYGALLRHCQGVAGGGQHLESPGLVAAPTQQQQEQQQAAQDSCSAALQEQVQQAVAEATASLRLLSAEQRQALLHSSDIHAATEQLLGMRTFLGGVSHKQYSGWAARTGYLVDGQPPSAEL